MKKKFVLLLSILLSLGSLVGCNKTPVDTNTPETHEKEEEIPEQPEEPVNPQEDEPEEPVNPQEDEPEEPEQPEEPVNPQEDEPDEPEEPEEPVHEHSFNEVVDEQYLVSNATIDNPATYYKTCECGEISNETFEYGSPLKYELLPNPLEDTFTAFFEDYVDFEMAEVIENILIPPFINRFIGRYPKVTFKRYSFNYESTYLDNSRIVLSGAITFPLLEGVPVINFVDVDNHATLRESNQAPSNQFGIFTFLAFAGALVIECDLLGYGRTDKIYPVDYHCKHLANRNTVDGVLAALEIIENDLHISLEGKKFFNTGYSQGGFDALSLMRYMETEATEYEKSRIPFIHNFCGSGAYDLSIMFEDSIKKEELEHPEYVVMGLMAAHDFHPEIFGDHVIEEYLTDFGKRYIQPIIEKDYAYIEYLATLVDENGDPIYLNPKNVFSFNYENPDPELLEILFKFSALENIVDGSWLPSGRLTLFYLPNDPLVSPNCSLKAIETFKGLENVDVVTGFIDDHAIGAVFYYIDVIAKISEYIL